MVGFVEASVDLAVGATWIVGLNEVGVREEVDLVVGASETGDDAVDFRVVAHHSSCLSETVLNDLEILEEGVISLGIVGVEGPFLDVSKHVDVFFVNFGQTFLASLEIDGVVVGLDVLP